MSRAATGLEVPIPTLPELVMRNASKSLVPLFVENTSEVSVLPSIPLSLKDAMDATSAVPARY